MRGGSLFELNIFKCKPGIAIIIIIYLFILFFALLNDEYIQIKLI